MTDDVFIPPPGAMQFEIETHIDAPETVGDRLWVLKKTFRGSRRMEGCSCAADDCYVVLHYRASDDSLVHRKTGGFICKCMGRFVE